MVRYLHLCFECILSFCVQTTGLMKWRTCLNQCHVCQKRVSLKHLEYFSVSVVLLMHLDKELAIVE